LFFAGILTDCFLPLSAFWEIWRARQNSNDSHGRSPFLRTLPVGFLFIIPATKYLYCGHAGESWNSSILSWMPGQVRHGAFAYLIADLIAWQTAAFY
jgi:hypothetical protein